MRSLREIRLQKGVSQKWVASQLGLSGNTIHQYEKGLRGVPAKVIEFYEKFSSEKIETAENIYLFAEKLIEEEITPILREKSSHYLPKTVLARILNDVVRDLEDNIEESRIRALIRLDVKFNLKVIE